MFQRSVLIALFLLTTLIFVQSNSIQSNIQEEEDQINSKALVRDRRQGPIVPNLLNALRDFLIQLLTNVGLLLITLGASLGGILLPLGLAGLGVILGSVLAAVGAFVIIISGRKRRAIATPPSCAQLMLNLNAAIVAQTKIKNMTSLVQNSNLIAQLTEVQTEFTSIKASLSSSIPPVATIIPNLQEALGKLDNVVGGFKSLLDSLSQGVSSDGPTIHKGLLTPLQCIADLGPNADHVIKAIGFPRFTALMQNITLAQNITYTNINAIQFSVSTMYSTTLALTKLATYGFDNLAALRLVDVLPQLLVK